MRSAEVQGAEWFVPASLASQLRREGLAALLQARLARASSTGFCLRARRSIRRRRFRPRRMSPTVLPKRFTATTASGKSSGARPRGHDRRASGDALGLLHPPRNRRMPQ
ncbi:MAG: hypothetical protein ACLRMJ_05595 [Alistipes finegoldii]